VLLALLSLLLPALSLADAALYEGSVPLKGAAEADRAAAIGEALRVAAIRASGSRDAAANPVIAAAANDPARYVQQYSTTPDRMLRVGFDSAAVEQLLQRAGLPLWPAERPTTLVALFVQGVAGGSRAVLDSEHPPERGEAERAAQLRGVPIAWPAQALGPAQARDRAATTGTASGVLVGSGAGTQLDWTFAHAGQSARAQGGVATGIDLAADTLAARYAPASTRDLTVQSVRVAGVTDLTAYAGLLAYLQSLSLVREVRVDEVSGDTVSLLISLRGDIQLLRRVAGLDTHLVAGAQPGGDAGGAGTDFTWQP
jgi:hypothetical protein